MAVKLDGRDSGSSPRRRGTLQWCFILVAASRIIPAQAGNTPVPCMQTCQPPDHPRAGGEHHGSHTVFKEFIGSSPRRRGTRLQSGILLLPGRIIPAQAGNTACQSAGNRPGTDHPRAGGEHMVGANGRSENVGSSPRRRGTRYHPVARHRRRRIIPAQAGNTAHAPDRTGSKSDHPRAGGEHYRLSTLADSIYGSSPRRRGTRLNPLRQIARIRIIPAQAGNTSPAATYEERTPDHPRAGGEHTVVSSALDMWAGSSPRRRGTHRYRRWRFGGFRIIPAQAGNTSTRSTSTASKADHPRAGGEHPRR